MSNIREYTISAAATETFGRVLCSTRDHYFIVDGPVQNGCPGEAITPVEVFLASIGACGVELVQVIARERAIPLRGVHVNVRGKVDRDHPVRSDFTVFNEVAISFDLAGVSDAEGASLVESFRGR